jgi:hypothetical protein
MNHGTSPDPAYLRNRDAYHHLVYTLSRSLPPPPDDTAEALALRNTAAIAQVAALCPANAAEATLAAQYVAAHAQAMECLRLTHARETPGHLTLKCNAQAANMMRQSQGAMRILLRTQAARQTRDANPEAATAAAWTEHAAVEFMTEKLTYPLPRIEAPSPPPETPGMPPGDPPSIPLGDTAGNPIGDTAGDPIGDTAGNPIGDTAGDPIGESAGDHPGESLSSRRCDTVGDPISDTAGKHFGKSAGEHFGEPRLILLGDTAGDPICDTAGKHFGKTTGEHLGEPPSILLGDTAGDSISDTAGKHFGETTGEHSGEPPSILLGDTAGDPISGPAGELITAAEAYVALYPQRAMLIRRLGRVPDDAQFGPPDEDVVRALVTGRSPVLTALDLTAT